MRGTQQHKDVSFRVLGPLEIVIGDRAVPLGGNQQRRTIAFLMLEANRVVATSRLIKALWGTGPLPQSARRIIQNAVWSLRRLLMPVGSGSVLLTQPPGYLLKVDPGLIDLNVFTSRVEDGQSRVAEGNAEDGARLLKEALSLWRGDALADLVESGVDWPELLPLKNARWDAQEDYYDAELACGRHHSVVRELEAAAQVATLRERQCEQLMLGLYRCGRSEDALDLYSRVRAERIETLGIDLGPRLQQLQFSILNHDRALLPQPSPSRPIVVNPPTSEPPVGVPVRTGPIVAAPVDREPASDYHQALLNAERRQVTAVLVHVHPEAGIGDPDSEDVDAVLARIATTIEEMARHFDGQVVTVVGSTWLLLFGAPRSHESDPTRAACAAAAIRDRIQSIAEQAGRPRRIGVRMAITTGEAITHFRPHGGTAVPSAASRVVVECQSLLAEVPPGQIRACDDTRRMSHSGAHDPAVQYSDFRETASPSWQVSGIGVAPAVSHPPIAEREYELDMLRGLLKRVESRGHAQVVAVLGEAGIGKTRLIEEFGRAVEQEGAARVMTTRLPTFLKDSTMAMIVDVSTRCFSQDLSKLTELWHLATPDQAGNADLWFPEERTDEVLRVLRDHFEDFASGDPFVLIIDNLHLAGDSLLNFIGTLNRLAVPLLVVVAGRPQLLLQCPDLGGGRKHSVTITLDPLSDRAIEDIVTSVAGGLDPSLLSALLADIGGNPQFAVEYGRMAAADHLVGRPNTREAAPAIPHMVRRLIASQLDGLEPETRQVLLDAAVVGDVVAADVVAALSSLGESKVAYHLDCLERASFLVRGTAVEDVDYVFRSTLYRQVTLSRIPRSALAAKRAIVAHR